MDGVHSVALLLFVSYATLSTLASEAFYNYCRQLGALPSSMMTYSYVLIANKIIVSGIMLLVCFEYFGIMTVLLVGLVSRPLRLLVEIWYNKKYRFGRCIKTLIGYAVVATAYLYAEPAYLRLIVVLTLAALLVAALHDWPDWLGLKSPVDHFKDAKIANGQLMIVLTGVLMILLSESVWQVGGLNSWIWFYAFFELIIMVCSTASMSLVFLLSGTWLDKT